MLLTSNGNEEKLVTIGLCLKNCEATIKETMIGILRQEFPFDQMEITVVDDGSSDNTIPIVVESLSDLKERLRIFSTEGKGLGTARQTVLENAKGKYIVWVDGDMILPKDHLRKQVEFMEKNPKVGKARARWGLLDERNLVANLESLRTLERGDFDLQQKASTTRFVGIGGSICRVNALKEAGAFDGHIKGAGEDIDIALRMRKKGWLLSVSHAKFYHRFRNTWKGLWDQYFWYGYGMHYVNHKHRGFFPFWTEFPPIAFIEGLLRSFTAYELTRWKSSFLLPLLYIFKQTAWCLGAIKGHRDGYGHVSNRIDA